MDRRFLLLCGAPLAAAHGMMMHPPNWFMTDGLPRVCPMMEGAAWDLGVMFYTNYTRVPEGVPVMPDDDPRRTFTDYSNPPPYGGPGSYSPRNPWRHPGASPVGSPCGSFGGNMRGCVHADGTPAPCVIGGTAFGADARDLYRKDGGSGPHVGTNITRTRWQRGSVVEAAHLFYSNHGGGYSFRLCRQPAGDPANVTEECFQAGALDFVGDKHTIQWGPDRSTRRTIPAVYTTNTTTPAGSMWARGPIPACAGSTGGYAWNYTDSFSATDCEPYPWEAKNLKKTQFAPPLPGLYGWGTDYNDIWPARTATFHKPGHYMPYFIIDRLQVPQGLPAGDYTLSWRWDCEQGAQVWTTCSDIEIVDEGLPVPEKEWAAWDDSCSYWPPKK